MLSIGFCPWPVGKIKMAEMRSLKAKRIREFATKTKKLGKKQRAQARKEFKKKVDSTTRPS